MDITIVNVVIFLAAILGLGFVSYMVSSAPVIDEPFKSIVKWVLILLAGLTFIWLLLYLFGAAPALKLW